MTPEIELREFEAVFPGFANEVEKELVPPDVETIGFYLWDKFGQPDQHLDQTVILAIWATLPDNEKEVWYVKAEEIINLLEVFSILKNAIEDNLFNVPDMLN